MLRILMTFLFLTTLSFNAYGALSSVYEGEVDSPWLIVGPCQDLPLQESPLVEKICLSEVKIKYKLWPQMGEPVEYYSVYWKIDPTLYLRSGSSSISSQSPAVQKAFAQLHPVDPTLFGITATYKDGPDSLGNRYSRSAFFQFDGGSLTGSGKGYSYNTPGSPDWSHFILNGFRIAGQYVSSDEAKKIFQQLDKQSFKFSGVKNLTFFGISELNAAIKGEQIYPLMINVSGASGSHISILNIKPPYRDGIELKPGRYHIHVEHAYFQPADQWVQLDAEHTEFNIQLKRKKSKEVEEFEDMLNETEATSDAHEIGDDLFTDNNPQHTDKDFIEDMLSDTEKAEILLQQPPQETDQDAIDVSGTVRGISSIDEMTIAIMINGVKQKAQINSNGSFTQSVALVMGQNVIAVEYSSAAKHAHQRVNINRIEAQYQPLNLLIFKNTPVLGK